MSDSPTTFCSLFRSPEIFGAFPGLVAAESTRHGGVSPAPYASLNLGGSTGDTPENVAENQRRFWKSIGVSSDQVVTSHQVHGTQVLHASVPGRNQGFDSLITDQPGLVLAVTVADCTPVLVFDPKRRAVAAIHAGWRGTVGEIVLKTIQRMQQEFGTDPSDCFAYVGTCIDKCSFEVGDEVAEHFSNFYKWFNSKAGKYYVDLKQANLAQLHGAGVSTERIQVSAYSTVLDNQDYFSHRLEKGLTGRMLACIGFV